MEVRRATAARGPVAQLGARVNGIHEVTGSTPVWSTTPSSGAPASSTQQADQPGHCSNDDAGDEGPAARQHPHLEGLDVFLGGHVFQRGFDPREPFLVRRHYHQTTRRPAPASSAITSRRRPPDCPGARPCRDRDPGNTGRRPRPLRACAPATSVLPFPVNRLSGCTRDGDSGAVGAWLPAFRTAPRVKGGCSAPGFRPITGIGGRGCATGTD